MPSRRALTLLSLAALAVLAFVVVGRALERHVGALDAWLTGLGPLAMVGYTILFVVCTTLLAPESVFAITAGALFGLSRGIALAMLGNLLAAALQYLLARRYFTRVALRLIGGNEALLRLYRVLGRGDLKLQALVRLTPVNPATISYVLGASGVRFRAFMVAIFASVPHVFAEVYLGFAGGHALRGASGGPPQAGYVHDALLLGGAAATVAVLAILSRHARRALDRAAQERSEGSR